MDNACFAWSVVAALYPAEAYGQNDIISTLNVGTESPGYTISNDIERHYKI